MTFTIPSFQLSSIGPWLTLTVTAILILVLDALSPKGRKVCFSWLALAGLAVAALQTIGLWGTSGTDFARMVYLDNFACFFYLIFILGAALTVLISRQYLEDYGKNMGEYYALILFIVWIGVYPSTFLDKTRASTENFLAMMEKAKTTQVSQSHVFKGEAQ